MQQDIFLNLCQSATIIGYKDYRNIKLLVLKNDYLRPINWEILNAQGFNEFTYWKPSNGSQIMSFIPGKHDNYLGDRFLTFTEESEILGTGNHTHIWNLVPSGKLPSYKIKK